MLREVAARIDTLPASSREKIICIQTAEGTTGDVGPYKGEPLDKRYVMPEEEWNALKFRAWLLYDELYRDKQPKKTLFPETMPVGKDVAFAPCTQPPDEA